MAHLLRIDLIARPVGALCRGDGMVIAERTYVAEGVLSRLVGMLGTPDPAGDEALVLAPCRAVHGVGLRARIGAAFVDAHGTVLRVVDPLPRRGASARGARVVLEARTGVLAALRAGDTVWLPGCHDFPLAGTLRAGEGGACAHPTRLPVTQGIRPCGTDRKEMQ